MYGTQLDRIDGELVLQAVEDEEGLNQRRAEMALMPMEIYLLFASEAGAQPMSIEFLRISCPFSIFFE